MMPFSFYQNMKIFIFWFQHNHFYLFITYFDKEKGENPVTTAFQPFLSLPNYLSKIIIQAASFAALQTIYIYHIMYITKTIQLIK
jgi:hypothetical protein